ncbi:hypothetical protein EV182_006652, partial [Spiromyces aspiralis]
RRAEDHEESGEWLDAARAYMQAADALDRIIANSTDYMVVSTIGAMRVAHLRQAKACRRFARQAKPTSVAAAKPPNRLIEDMPTVAIPDQDEVKDLIDLSKTQLLPPPPDPSSSSSSSPAESRTTSKPAANSSSAAAGSGVNSERNHEEAFEHFWNYINQWVSNPVAFTSVPLNPGNGDLSGDHHQSGTNAGRLANTSTITAAANFKNALESFYMVPSNLD